MSASRTAQAARTLLEVRRLAVGRGKRRHLNKLNCASSVQTLFSALAEDALQRANGAPAEAALGDGRWARCRRDDVVRFRDAGCLLLRDVILLAVIEPARPAGRADDDGVPGGDRRGKACLVHDAAEFAAPSRTESAALSATWRR